MCFCHESSFELNNEIRRKEFQKKTVFKFSVSCKSCGRGSCLSCIDVILKKFLVQSRSDPWYLQYLSYQHELFCMKEKGLRSFSLTSDYCNSCQVSKRLNFAQCTSCYPNEEYAGDDYDEEDDLFEDSLDESNDEHSLSADDKKPNEQLEELQADSLRERIVPLTRGQRRVEARRKKMKKNNGDDGVNSVTDEVRYCIIYCTLYY